MPANTAAHGAAGGAGAADPTIACSVRSSGSARSREGPIPGYYGGTTGVLLGYYGRTTEDEPWCGHVAAPLLT